MQVAFVQLDRLRWLIETHLQDLEQLFGSKVQDFAFLMSVRVAFRCKGLWTFIRVSLQQFLQPLENIRRWGLVCSCHVDDRHSGGPKKSRCDRASRRMHEVRKYILLQIADFQQRGSALNITDCENDVDLCRSTSFTLRSLASEMGVKTIHHCRVPYLLSEADDPAVAQTCFEQLQAIPEDDLDEMMRWYRDNLCGPLEVVSNGGGVQPILADTIRRLRHTPIDEGVGEGYHRTTHLTKMRSFHSKVAWLLGSTRLMHDLNLIREFLSSNGTLAATVLRFEWKRFKRLLRPSDRKKWIPLKYSDKTFFNKLYRIERNPDDWSALINAKAPRTSDDDDPKGGDFGQVKNEWLRSVFKKDETYSVQEVRYADEGVGHERPQ